MLLEVVKPEGSEFQMAVMEKHTLDMSGLLMQAYDIGDMINNSAEVADYLYWKKAVEEDRDIQQWVKKLEQKKQLFEECQRFGHFHPDYHSALDQVNQIQAELDKCEAVKRFKSAEDKLDDMLFQVSQTIAYSVSETIKVPSNNPLPTSGGCASGGSCSGGCG